MSSMVDLLTLANFVISIGLAVIGSAMAFWTGYMVVKYRCGMLVVNRETFTCSELLLYLIVAMCADLLAVGIWILPI